jgi:thiol-disulfide isomerase/thioredoxin
MKKTLFTAALVVFGLIAYDQFVYRRPSIPKGDQPSSGADAEKIAVIAHSGEAVDLDRHAVPGGVTVFDFYADWCGPCKRIAPRLEELVRDRDGVFLRKINIKNWKTPVVRKYGIRSIPAIWIYGPDGRLEKKNVRGLTAIRKTVDSLL